MPNPFRYLPFSSVCVFMYENGPDDEGAERCCLFHLIYNVLGTAAIIGYVFSAIHFESLNPFEMKRMYDQNVKIREVEVIEKKGKYSDLYYRVFGPRGIADTNFDTMISEKEKISAYRKMGFDKPFFEGQTLPEPTIEQLEQYIKVYEEN